MSYPGGVESFDAYHGLIETVYSQVWWTSATDALPADIVKRFDGKVMAIVGVEMDQLSHTHPHAAGTFPSRSTQHTITITTPSSLARRRG